MVGAQVVLLDPLAEQAWLASDLHYLGHENSALSLFVGPESDPRGHDLSYLKPGIDIGELVSVSRGSS
jgi:hypothetical protein